MNFGVKIVMKNSVARLAGAHSVSSSFADPVRRKKDTPEGRHAEVEEERGEEESSCRGKGALAERHLRGEGCRVSDRRRSKQKGTKRLTWKARLIIENMNETGM